MQHETCARLLGRPVTAHRSDHCFLVGRTSEVCSLAIFQRVMQCRCLSPPCRAWGARAFSPSSGKFGPPTGISPPPHPHAPPSAPVTTFQAVSGFALVRPHAQGRPRRPCLRLTSLCPSSYLKAPAACLRLEVVPGSRGRWRDFIPEGGLEKQWEV